MKTTIKITLVLILLLSSPALAAEWKGRVMDVIDGDSFIISRKGRPVEVRLQGVDAPEYNQPYGFESLKFAEELSLDQKVRVVVVTWDRYRRTVAYVYLSDGREIGQEMVRAGLAWWYQKYDPDNTTLENLEEDARAARRGLWADPEPLKPWLHRRYKK